jgi:hypothetical protein
MTAFAVIYVRDSRETRMDGECGLRNRWSGSGEESARRSGLPVRG